jgi:hypothetical protein
MRDHLKLLGILNIVWSSISLLIGLLVLLVFGGLAGLFGAAGIPSGAWNENSGALLVAPFMAIIGFAIVLLVCVLSLPAFIGGLGLVKLKSWSRILMIVISIFHLFSIPIGTALGVYGLWVLFQPEAKHILEGGVTLPVHLDRPEPPLASV